MFSVPFVCLQNANILLLLYFYFFFSFHSCRCVFLSLPETIFLLHIFSFLFFLLFFLYFERVHWKQFSDWIFTLISNHCLCARVVSSTGNKEQEMNKWLIHNTSLQLIHCNPRKLICFRLLSQHFVFSFDQIVSTFFSRLNYFLSIAISLAANKKRNRKHFSLKTTINSLQYSWSMSEHEMRITKKT